MSFMVLRRLDRLGTAHVEWAAEFLDRIRPGWENEIDLKRLDMTEPEHCIVGQLFGQYSEGLDTLEAAGYPKGWGAFGVADEYWIKQIERRKRK